jgi:hypothetical protein
VAIDLQARIVVALDGDGQEPVSINDRRAEPSGGSGGHR